MKKHYILLIWAMLMSILFCTQGVAQTTQTVKHKQVSSGAKETLKSTNLIDDSNIAKPEVAPVEVAVDPANPPRRIPRDAKVPDHSATRQLPAVLPAEPVNSNSKPQ